MEKPMHNMNKVRLVSCALVSQTEREDIQMSKMAGFLNEGSWS